VLNLKTGKVKFDEPLYLESGRILPEFELAYETYGELNEDKSKSVRRGPPGATRKPPRRGQV